MRSCFAGLSVALVSDPFLFGALPDSAKPTEFQDNSFHTDLDGDPSTLEAEGTRAYRRIACGCASVHDGSATLAEAETDGANHVLEFLPALNERKAGLGMIGAEPTTPTDQDDAAELTTPLTKIERAT